MEYGGSRKEAGEVLRKSGDGGEEVPNVEKGLFKLSILFDRICYLIKLFAISLLSVECPSLL